MALIAQYLFKNNANDEKGTYNGTPTNVTYEASPIGYNFSSQVAVFNGSNSKIDLPNISAISGTNARTIEFWQYSNNNTDALDFTFSQGDGARNGAEFSASLINTEWNRPIVAIAGVVLEYGVTTPSQAWHHHAFILPANGNAKQIRYYLDGVLQANHSSDTTTLNTSNNNFALGYRRRSNAFFLNGKLANFRIYNEEVSQATLISHYINEGKPPTPIAQYLFNGNGNDETNTYNGTPSNVTYENAPAGYHFGDKVAVFNGSSSKIELPKIPSIAGAASASYEFWVYMTTSNYQCWLSAGERVAGQERVLMCGDAGYQYVTFGNNSFYESAAPQTNHWVHLCYVVPANSKPADVKLYVNGHLQPMTSTSGTTSFNADNVGISIGYRQSVNAGYISGKLGNFRIYTGELSANDVMNHYLTERKQPKPIAQYLFNGNANDETNTYNGSSSNITYEDAPLGFNFGNKVAIFNGTSSKINLPNISPIKGTFSKTYEFWQYTDSNSDGSWRVSFGQGNATGGAFCGAWLCSPENRVKIDIYGASVEFGSSPTPKNSWHHHVFVFPETAVLNDCKYYLDGVEQTRNNSNTTLVNPPNTNYAIGYRAANNGNFISGKMGNLRIYNDILTPEEIKAHYIAESSTPAQTTDFDYTGTIQAFTAPKTGTYKLECWGGQGGGATAASMGGYGGYSCGQIKLAQGDTIYIAVGGKGNDGTNFSRVRILGGFNGGGIGWQYSQLYAGGGGGATHVATTPGTLATLALSKSSVLIVAGGGAGGYYYSGHSFISMAGGGYIGGYTNNSSHAGSQTTGYGFGQGQYKQTDNPDTNNRAGGGGGWYGGLAYWGEDRAGGGSGYIGNSSLSNKHMAGYNVSTSADTDTKTITTTSYSSTPTTDYAKQGNGFVRISIVEPNQDFNTAALLLMMV